MIVEYLGKINSDAMLKMWENDYPLSNDKIGSLKMVVNEGWKLAYFDAVGLLLQYDGQYNENVELYWKFINLCIGDGGKVCIFPNVVTDC